MLATATAGPSPNDVLLLPRPALRCARCRRPLAKAALSLGALLGKVSEHIDGEHSGGGRWAGWPDGGRQATPPDSRLIAHRADDGSIPTVLDFDLFVGEGVYCGLASCGHLLATARTTPAQLLDRVACHVRQRHSGRPRSLRELRAAHGLPTGLPDIRRPSW